MDEPAKPLVAFHTKFVLKCGGGNRSEAQKEQSAYFHCFDAEKRGVKEYFPTEQFFNWLQATGDAFNALIEEKHDGYPVLRAVLDFSDEYFLTDEIFIELNAFFADSKQHEFKGLYRLLQNVEDIFCEGCIHLTDYALLKIRGTFGRLKKLSLNGCKNITNTGLQYLRRSAKIGRMQNLPELNLKGTSVTLHFPEWGFVPEGCPLISKQPIVLPGRAKSSGETVEELPPESGAKKLLILSNQSCKFNLTEFLIDGAIDNDMSGKLCYTEAVLPLQTGSNNYSYNIFECHCKLGANAPFLSDKSVFVIQVRMEEQVHIPIMHRMESLRAVQQDARFIIVVLINNRTTKKEMSELAKLGPDKLMRFLEYQAVTMDEHLEEDRFDAVNRHTVTPEENRRTGFKGYKADRDFRIQQRYSASHRAQYYNKVHQQVTVLSLNTDQGLVNLLYPEEREKQGRNEKRQKAMLEKELGIYAEMRGKVDFTAIRDHSQEIHSLNEPSPTLLNLARGVLVTLYPGKYPKAQSKDAYSASNIWKDAQNVISKKEFPDLIENFKIQDVSPRSIRVLHHLGEAIQNPEDTAEKLKEVGPLYEHLWRWLASLYQHATQVKVREDALISNRVEKNANEAVNRKVKQEIEAQTQRLTNLQQELARSRTKWLEKYDNEVQANLDGLSQSDIAYIRLLSSPPKDLLEVVVGLMICLGVEFSPADSNSKSKMMDLANAHVFEPDILHTLRAFDPEKQMTKEKVEQLEPTVKKELMEKVRNHSVAGAAFYAWQCSMYSFYKDVKPRIDACDRQEKLIEKTKEQLILDVTQEEERLEKMTEDLEKNVKQAKEDVTKTHEELNKLDRSHLNELTALRDRPKALQRVIDGVLILFEKSGKKTVEWWRVAGDLIGSDTFLADIYSYDMNKLKDEMLLKLNQLMPKTAIHNEEFSSNASANQACVALWKWVLAMQRYGNAMIQQHEQIIAQNKQIVRARQQRKPVAKRKRMSVAEEERKLETIKKDIEKDLKMIEPDLNDARTALNSLSKADLSELKQFAKPPRDVITVWSAILILLEKEPRGSKTDTASKEGNIWKAAKQVLSRFDFLQEMLSYDPNRISHVMSNRLNKIVQEGLTVEQITKVSKACTSLWRWVLAMHKYAKVMKPRMTVYEAQKKAVETAKQEEKHLLPQDKAKEENPVKQKESAALNRLKEEMNRLYNNLEAVRKVEITNLKAARYDVGNLNKAKVTELRSYSKPPIQVAAPVRAAVTALGHPDEVTDYSAAKRILSSIDVRDEVQKADPEEASEKTMAQLSKILEEGLNRKEIDEISRGAGALWAWATAFYRYNQTVRMPLQRYKEAEEKVKAMEKELLRKQITRSDLPTSYDEGMKACREAEKGRDEAKKKLTRTKDMHATPLTNSKKEIAQMADSKLDEVRMALSDPTDALNRVLMATRVLLESNPAEKSESEENHWLLQYGIEQIQRFDEDTVKDSTMEAVKEILQEGQDKSVTVKSSPHGELLRWLRCVQVYWKICGSLKAEIESHDENVRLAAERLAVFQELESLEPEENKARTLQQNYEEALQHWEENYRVKAEASLEKRLDEAIAFWKNKLELRLSNEAEKAAPESRRVPQFMPHLATCSQGLYICLSTDKEFAKSQSVEENADFMNYETTYKLLSLDLIPVMNKLQLEKKKLTDEVVSQLQPLVEKYPTVEDMRRNSDEHLSTLWLWVLTQYYHSSDVIPKRVAMEEQSKALKQLHKDLEFLYEGTTDGKAEHRGASFIWELIVEVTKHSIVWEHNDMENFTWTDYVQLVWDVLKAKKQKVKVTSFQEVVNAVREHEIPDRSVDAILKKLHIQGFILYYHAMETRPVVLNLDWLMSLLNAALRMGNDNALQNGNRCSALPRTIPLFTRNYLLDLWQNTGSDKQECLICYEILCYFGLLINAPSQACDFEKKTKDCMFFFTHLSDKPSLWEPGGKEKISAGHFVSWYWPEDTNASVLPSDVQVDYWYKFTVGMPVEVLMQVMAECAKLGYVQHVWTMGIVSRVGAVDILLKNVVHGTQVSSGITVQARMTKIDESANRTVLQQYLWSVVSVYLLVIEYFISKYPQLHVRHRVPCLGKCRNTGISEIYSVTTLPRNNFTLPKCSRCPYKGAMSLEDVPYLTGRMPILPFHDFRDQRDHGIVDNPAIPYHPVWDGHSTQDDNGYAHFLCGHCGITRHAAMKLWTMQSQLYPTEPYRSYDVLQEGGFTVYASKHPLYLTGLRDFHVTAVDSNEDIEIVLAREEYFTSRDIFRELKKQEMVDIRLLVNLNSGSFMQRNPDLDKGDVKGWTRKSLDVFQPGDMFSMVANGNKLQEGVGEEMFMMIEICLKKNGRVLLTTTIPFRTYFGVVIKRRTEEKAPVQCLYECPSFPYVRAENFIVGSAVYYKTGVGNQYTIGIVKAIQDGKIHVTIAQNESRAYDPDSMEILPVAIYSDITVVMNGEVLKNRDQVIEYLLQNNCTPAPFGLFIQLYNNKMQLSGIHLRGPMYRQYQGSCTASIHSPLVLSNTYEHHMLGLGKNSRKSCNTLIYLPHHLAHPDIVHSPRHRVQDWRKQNLHILCRGSDWSDPVSGQTNNKDVHFILDKPISADSVPICTALTQTCETGAGEASHIHFNQDVVTAYYFMVKNIGVLQEHVPSSLVKTEEDSKTCSKLSQEEIEGLYRILALYKDTFILINWLYDVGQGYSKHKAAVMGSKTFLKNVVETDSSASNVAVAYTKQRYYMCNTHTLTAKKLTFKTITAENLGDFAFNVKYIAMSTLNMRNYFSQLLDWFPNLEGISLPRCDVRSLDGIHKCSLLKILDLTDNHLSEISSDLQALKGTLEGFAIGGNPVSELPNFLTEMKLLSQLHLGNTLIEELPEDIGKLENLTILNCRFSIINRLPESFRKLQKLSVLILTGIPRVKEDGEILTYDEWTKWIKNYYALDALPQEEKDDLFYSSDLRKNQTLDREEIGLLNEKLLKKFPRFGDGQHGKPGDFPLEILSCRALKIVTLNHQLVTSIPDGIRKLRKLNKCVFSNNEELQSLSASLGQLYLQVLDIKNCPKLKTPPQEIIKQGMKVVLAYLKRLSQGSIRCNRTKLMFVGLGGAGKTSLTRALMAQDFRAPSTETEAITDGIDISTWTVKYQQVELQYSVWDFAGQTVYYNTHQFFLSNRALYLLVWNTRLGYEHSGLDFWLSSIACHCPKAPIFIVGTHADKITKPELPEGTLKKRHQNIAGFFTVSSLTGQGIEVLYNTILQTTLEQPYIGEMIPESWLNTGKSIVAKRGEKNLLDWSVVEAQAHNEGIYGAEVKQAIGFLHELGTVQHFDNDFLKNKVVINPQWIVDVMACVVSVHNKVIVDGRFEHKDKGRIWKDYPKDIHDWLLKLTEVFDLTFPLPDQKVSLVPCLLPQIEPKYNWPCLEDEPESKETLIVYNFDYLPAGLFNRAQVRLYQFSDSNTMWKTGSVLTKNNHHALLQQTGSSTVVVKVFGQRPENILLLIHEVFESLIADFFRGVKYEYQIPCKDCIEIRTEEPTLFSSKVLRKAIELKALFLQCHSFFHTLSISEIQGSLPPQSSGDYEIQLENAMRDLDEMKNSMKSDVFILHCDKDLPSDPDQVKVVDIRNVKAELEKQKYKCWFAENLGQLSIEQVAMAMKNSKIILVFVSDDFVEDDHCKRLFQFAKNSLRKDIQLCMVGFGRKWMESSFIGIQVAEQVFVNFQRFHQFRDKIAELLRHLGNKLTSESRDLTQEFDVFLSYAWTNSQSAIDAGHARKQHGSVSHGDPRKIKQLLKEAADLSVWMDIEQVGRKGLYEDIAVGIKHSKVVVACVSDEYALSTNCQLEFRFAHNLRKPIILAVVGTGFKWESTEIGMLSLGYPKINFQVANNIAEDEIVACVGEALGEVTEEEGAERPFTPSSMSHKEMAFQELYELAQRKLLRQVSGYADDRDQYPRIFVVDLVYGPSENAAPDQEAVVDDVDVELEEDTSRRHFVFDDLRAGQFCMKVLCEYEGGWHSVSEGFPIELAGNSLLSVWRASAPYMGQIMAILRHSNINLNIVKMAEGEKLIKNLAEIMTKEIHADTKPIYQALRTYIMSKDTGCTRGNLKRCYTPSGKTLWLCEEHQTLPRITVLDDPEFYTESDSESPEQQLQQALDAAVRSRAEKTEKLKTEATMPTAYSRPKSARPKSAKRGAESPQLRTRPPIRRKTTTASNQLPFHDDAMEDDIDIQLPVDNKTGELPAKQPTKTGSGIKSPEHAPSPQARNIRTAPRTLRIERTKTNLTDSEKKNVLKTTKDNMAAVMSSGRLSEHGTSVACSLL